MDESAAIAALLHDAATGARLTSDDMHRVVEHTAHAGFNPEPITRAGGRIAGSVWNGRTLKGSDRLPNAEAHFLRHVIVSHEWPVGTDMAAYLRSIRAVIRDADSGIALNLFQQQLHLTFVRRSGTLRGPGGWEWVMVEYRVDLGYWMTAFQPERGMGHITENPDRELLRWLRHAT